MHESGIKLMDVVVECPDCHERIALPVVPVTEVLVKKGGVTYLTAEIGDVPLVQHRCRTGGNGFGESYITRSSPDMGMTRPLAETPATGRRD